MICSRTFARYYFIARLAGLQAARQLKKAFAKAAISPVRAGHFLIDASEVLKISSVKALLVAYSPEKHSSTAAANRYTPRSTGASSGPVRP